MEEVFTLDNQFWKPFLKLIHLIFSEIEMVVIIVNSTSYCPVRSVIMLVINKSDSRLRWSDFVMTRLIKDQMKL